MSLLARVRAALARRPVVPAPAPRAPDAVLVPAPAPAPAPPAPPAEPAWVSDLDARARRRTIAPLVERKYQDLPVVSVRTNWDTVTAVRAALVELELGMFQQTAEVVEAMLADDRVKGVVSQRIDGLLGLPFTMVATDEKDELSSEIAAEALRLWPQMADEAVVRDVWKWGRFVGIGVAEKLYDTEGPDGWVPRLKLWHPRFIYWRWDTRSYWLNTMTGPVELKENDPHWLLYTPYGYQRGWMEGLVRSLAIPWLFRQFGYRDWGRYNEVHGLPIRAILEPSEWADEEKQKALREVAVMASESIVRLPQIAGKGGFDMKLIEAAAQTYDSFKLCMEQANDSIAITVLGQNLTSQVKGGAYSAAQVHERVAASIMRSDTQTLGGTLKKQVVKEWVAFNYGKPELTPTPTWDTKPPEDKKARAEALDKLADAIKKLSDAGAPVDVNALCQEFGVPLRELTEAERKRVGLPQIYQYHIENRIPTRNEVRERLGLPPRDDGDELTGAAPPAEPDDDEGEGDEEPPKGKKGGRGGAGMLARADGVPPGVRAGQAYADDLVEEGHRHGAGDLEPDVAHLMRIVRETPAGRDGKPDANEIKRRLLAAFDGMDPARLSRTVMQCMVLAQMQGRVAVLEDAGEGTEGLAEGLPAPEARMVLELGPDTQQTLSQLAAAVGAPRPPPAAMTITRDADGRVTGLAPAKE